MSSRVSKNRSKDQLYSNGGMSLRRSMSPAGRDRGTVQNSPVGRSISIVEEASRPARAGFTDLFNCFEGMFNPDNANMRGMRVNTDSSNRRSFVDGDEAVLQAKWEDFAKSREEFDLDVQRFKEEKSKSDDKISRQWNKLDREKQRLQEAAESHLEQIRLNHEPQIREELKEQHRDDVIRQLREEHHDSIRMELHGTVLKQERDALEEAHRQLEVRASDHKNQFRNELADSMVGEIRDMLWEQHKEDVIQELKREHNEPVIKMLRENLQYAVTEQLKEDHLEDVLRKLEQEHTPFVKQMLSNELRMEVREELKRGPLSEDVKHELRNEHHESIKHELRQTHKATTIDELRKELRDELAEQVFQELRDDHTDFIKDELRNSCKGEVVNQLRTELRDHVINHVKSDLKQEHKDSVIRELKEEYREQAIKELREQLKDVVYNDLQDNYWRDLYAENRRLTQDLNHMKAKVGLREAAEIGSRIEARSRSPSPNPIKLKKLTEVDVDTNTSPAEDFFGPSSPISKAAHDAQKLRIDKDPVVARAVRQAAGNEFNRLLQTISNEPTPVDDRQFPSVIDMPASRVSDPLTFKRLQGVGTKLEEERKKRARDLASQKYQQQNNSLNDYLLVREKSPVPVFEKDKSTGWKNDYWGSSKTDTPAQALAQRSQSPPINLRKLSRPSTRANIRNSTTPQEKESGYQSRLMNSYVSRVQRRRSELGLGFDGEC